MKLTKEQVQKDIELVEEEIKRYHLQLSIATLAKQKLHEVLALVESKETTDEPSTD